MPIPSETLPTIAELNATADPKVRACLLELQTILTGDVDDDNLLSPSNGNYRQVHQGGGYAGGLATGTYYFSTAGTLVAQSAASTSAPPWAWYYVASDHEVDNLTTRFRIRIQAFVGSTAPSTVTLTAGLYPLTVSGGNYTLGTVVTGSTAVPSSLSTNSTFQGSSGDFSAAAVPPNGPYVFGVVVGSITCPAGIGLNVQLERRNT